MPLLHNGDRFPRLSIRKVGGGTIELPNDLDGAFGVVLIYRGAWCPYCNAQLAAFARAGAKLDEAGVKVVAFSVDDETTTAALAAKHNVRFSIGLRRRRRRDRRRGRRLRQPGAALPADDRLRAGARRNRGQRRLFVGRDRTAGPRRRRRARRLRQVEDVPGVGGLTKRRPSLAPVSPPARNRRLPPPRRSPIIARSLGGAPC